jgi:hypothetical protein
MVRIYVSSPFISSGYISEILTFHLGTILEPFGAYPGKGSGKSW